MAINIKPATATVFGSEVTDDYLQGTADNDTLSGGGAIISYVNSSDSNSFIGSLGDDVYIINNSNDVVIEATGEGIDTLYTTVNYSLPDEVENIASVGVTGLVLTGNAQANRLDGLQNIGSDTLIGMKGDDIYFIGTADKVIEGTGNNNTIDPGGVDTLITSSTTNIAANSLTITGALYIENIVLTGASAINAVGNNKDNKLMGNTGINNLSGNAGNDWLDGGLGADILAGGTGDDIYVVDNAADSVFEATKAGNDWVLAAINWTLGSELENLRLTANTATSGVGNALNNTLIGNGVANTLIGNDGNDKLTGASGNDSLIGGNGNDTLEGSAGQDTLVGGVGDDIYVIDGIFDSIIENSGTGIDTVWSSVDWTLPNELENLTLTGAAVIKGAGNALANILIGNTVANTLTGNEGNDTLNGGAGEDTLAGGAGDDVYVVDAFDSLIETSNAGLDTVKASINWTLGNDLENLTLNGAASIRGVGNALANVLIGNDGANSLVGNDGNDTLDGGAGRDTLSGGTGADTYVMDNLTDIILEDSNAGIDTVKAAINWTLGNDLENLILMSNVRQGTGNALANVLIGNAAPNILVGGNGNDTITGGAGKDTVSAGEGNDILTFAAGTTDTVATANSITGIDLYNDLTLNAAVADKLQLTVAIANIGAAVSGFITENTFVTTMNALLSTGSGRGFATDTVGTTTAAIATATAGSLVGRSFLAVDLDGSDSFTAKDFVI